MVVRRPATAARWLPRASAGSNAGCCGGLRGGLRKAALGARDAGVPTARSSAQRLVVFGELYDRVQRFTDFFHGLESFFRIFRHHFLEDMFQ